CGPTVAGSPRRTACAPRRPHRPGDRSPAVLDLHRPSRGGYCPLAVEAVANDQTTTGDVPLIGQLGEVGVDLGFQCGGQHSPGALPDDLVDQGAVRRHPVGINYGKHGRALPADVGASTYSVTFESITREATPHRADPQVLSIAPLDLSITSQMLRVELDGAGQKLPAHVGCRVDLVGSKRTQKDRLDDHGDDQGAFDFVSNAWWVAPFLYNSFLFL